MDFSSPILLLLHGVLAGCAVTHALLFKRDSQAALGWIGVCVFFPLAGPVLYGVFGVNRVRTRARMLRQPGLTSWLGVDYERGEPVATPDVGDPGLAQVGYRISEWPARAGNAVTVLHDGEQAYPAMLDALAAARERAYLCSYIFDTDAAGRTFIDALIDARRRGVDVRVIVDGVGERYSRPRVSRLLQAAGVPVATFLPPTLWPPALRLNLRTHRKLLAIDGRTAFAGGINIGDRHLATAGADRAVDIHFRLEGPIAADLEALFIEDWQFLSGHSQDPIKRAPPLQRPTLSPPAGRAACRLIGEGPNEDMDRLTTLYLGVLGAAAHRVSLMTPYFLPPRELRGALIGAALRGVEVTILLPGHNNLPYVHWASRHDLWELLQWGVRIYYQPAPFVHSKLLLIDDHYTLIGSANLDARSLRLNFELGIEIFDADLNQRLAEHFRQALERAEPLHLDALLARPLWQRLRDAVAALFAPYL